MERGHPKCDYAIMFELHPSTGWVFHYFGQIVKHQLQFGLHNYRHFPFTDHCQIIICRQVNVISYMDEIASLIGAKPNLWHLLTTDPQLAFRCFFGPCIPAQYRLLGPGAWLGARDIIMGVQDSTLFPLKTRKIGSQDRTNKIISRKGSGLSWMLGIFVALILFILMRILL